MMMSPLNVRMVSIALPSPNVALLRLVLAPRGRCHYFINETSLPMAMIWVYGGDMPERMVLEENCCSAAVWPAPGPG